MPSIMQPIPHIDFPNIKNFSILDKEESLVSLTNIGLFCESQYYKQGIKGAYKDCYARRTVADMLLKAEAILSDMCLHLKIYDAYRPWSVQNSLWQFYRKQVAERNKFATEEEIDFMTSHFVSKPDKNIMRPFLHNTGGAVDLTLVDDDFNELDMGTVFDDFSYKAWTDYYESHDLDQKVRENRRILYNIMHEVGFTNLPSEWWHYDYGTKFWGYFTNQVALYAGILDADFPDRI